jgi:hypothetical protein
MLDRLLFIATLPTRAGARRLRVWCSLEVTGAGTCIEDLLAAAS